MSDCLDKECYKLLVELQGEDSYQAKRDLENFAYGRCKDYQDVDVNVDEGDFYIRSIVYLTLKALGENATDCKIEGVMKYIEENK